MHLAHCSSWAQLCTSFLLFAVHHWSGVHIDISQHQAQMRYSCEIDWWIHSFKHDSKKAKLLSAYFQSNYLYVMASIASHNPQRLFNIFKPFQPNTGDLVVAWKASFSKLWWGTAQLQLWDVMWRFELPISHASVVFADCSCGCQRGAVFSGSPEWLASSFCTRQGPAHDHWEYSFSHGSHWTLVVPYCVG